MKKIIGLLCMFISVVIIAFVLYGNSKYSQTTRTFSPYTILSSSWEEYKVTFINDDGRVIDKSQKEMTTSEGQSYAMLRAVWIDDKATFDLVWQWTKDNLDRPNDKLLGWKWGKLENGKYGFLPDGGDNAASDADSDIALALLLANRRWGDEAYKGDALEILQDMWQLETAVANNQRYLIAGNWASSTDRLIINPSYFAPYAWKIFAQEDTEHDWESLIDPAYELLERIGTEPLDKSQAVGLPADWVEIRIADGQILPPSLQHLKTDYSFDAMRTPWRIALDYQWNKDERAKAYLTNSYDFLQKEYTGKNKLVSGYTHDGQPLTEYENASLYATALSYFMVTNPTLAKQMYEEKILKLYSTRQDAFNKDLPYYEQNWLWFGAALYNNFLVPFT